MENNAAKYLKSLRLLSPERRQELLEIQINAIANFSGQINELESAIGMLHMGDHIGWRALLIVHSKRTIKNYEKILNIDVREFFPDEGPCASRSVGYKFAKTLSNYWKAVSGDTKIEDRREFT